MVRLSDSHRASAQLPLRESFARSDETSDQSRYEASSRSAQRNIDGHSACELCGP